MDGSANISTIAGNGTTGISPSGTTASSAKLESPKAVFTSAAAAPASTVIYAADYTNNRLLSIPASAAPGSQPLNVVGGSGTAGYDFDGQSATRAEISKPWGVTFNESSELVFADSANNRVRRIDGSGNIQAVAGAGFAGYGGDGGPGTGGLLNKPEDLIYDSGNDILYIADTGNHRIRAITGATGGSPQIKTIAGTGVAGSAGDGGQAASAQLNRPVSITLGSSSSLYIADAGNNKIRKITSTGTLGTVAPSANTMSTVAGTGAAGNTGDTGAGTSATLNNPSGIDTAAANQLVLSDSGNNRLRQLNTSSGIINHYSGSTAGTAGFVSGNATTARFNNPTDILCSASPSCYVADPGNHSLRLVNSAVTSAASLTGTGSAVDSGDWGGYGSAGINTPGSIITDSLGSPWFVDRGNDRVRLLQANPVGTRPMVPVAGIKGASGSTGEGVPATSARMDDVTGITLNVAGGITDALFVAENSRIRQLVPTAPDPAWLGVSSASTGFGSITSLVGSAPVSAVHGSGLVAAVSMNTPAGADLAITPPAGWTTLVEQYDPGASAGTKLWVGVRTMQYTDTSWAWNFAGGTEATLAIVALSGIDLSALTSGDSAIVGQSSSTATRATPSISPSASRYLLSFYGDRSGSQWIPPTGDKMRAVERLGSSASLAFADAGVVAAGTYSRTATSGTASTVGNQAILGLPLQ